MKCLLVKRLVVEMSVDLCLLRNVLIPRFSYDFSNLVGLVASPIVNASVLLIFELSIRRVDVLLNILFFAHLLVHLYFKVFSKSNFFRTNVHH